MPGLQQSSLELLPANIQLQVPLCVCVAQNYYYIVILQQLLKLQPFIFVAHYLSEKGLPANIAKIKGPLTLWDLQYTIEMNYAFTFLYNMIKFNVMYVLLALLWTEAF